MTESPWFVACVVIEDFAEAVMEGRSTLQAQRIRFASLLREERGEAFDAGLRAAGKNPMSATFAAARRAAVEGDETEDRDG